MPAKYGRDRGKKPFLERLGLYRKRSASDTTEEEKKAGLFNRPKAVKTFWASFGGWAITGLCALVLIIAFILMRGCNQTIPTVVHEVMSNN